MKKYIIIFLLLFILIGCENHEKVYEQWRILDRTQTEGCLFSACKTSYRYLVEHITTKEKRTFSMVELYRINDIITVSTEESNLISIGSYPQ